MKRLICLLFKHLWKKINYIRYDSVGGYNYYICKRCYKTKKEWITEYL